MVRVSFSKADPDSNIGTPLTRQSTLMIDLTADNIEPQSVDRFLDLDNPYVAEVRVYIQNNQILLPLKGTVYG